MKWIDPKVTPPPIGHVLVAVWSFKTDHWVHFIACWREDLNHWILPGRGDLENLEVMLMVKVMAYAILTPPTLEFDPNNLSRQFREKLKKRDQEYWDQMKPKAKVIPFKQQENQDGLE